MLRQTLEVWRPRRVVLGVALVAGVLAGVIGAAGSAAAAESPRWHIDVIGNPSRLVPNSPRNEVEEVTVQGSGGTFTLTYEAKENGGLVPHATTPLAYGASAGEVQAALEDAYFTLEGHVSVAAGSGGGAPYTITFAGGEVDGPQALTANGTDLTGPAAEASVHELVHGVYEPELMVMATNVGGAAAAGGTITVSDALPPGMTATTVSGWDSYKSEAVIEGRALAGRMSCEPSPMPTCTDEGSVMPGDALIMRIQLDVAGNAEGAPNLASVTGDGAEASNASPLEVGPGTPSFGPQPGSVFAALSSDQAGGHPDVTTGFALNTQEKGLPAADPQKIRFDLSPGLVGQAVGMPRCTMAAVAQMKEHPFACPSDTFVGMATVSLLFRSGKGMDGEAPYNIVVPVVNIAPAPGEPVAFAFTPYAFPVRLDTSVLSNGDYGVRVTAQEISEEGGVLSTVLTIWGVPAEYSAPGSDFTFFSIVGDGLQTFGGPQPNVAPVPLLTSPEQCGTPLTASMETDSWTDIGHFVGSGPLSMGTLTGCELLRFEPSFTMLPDTLEAGEPAGYSFNLTVPQHNEVGVPGTPSVKNVKLTLPAGTVVNPAAAWGLKACSNTEFYGPQGSTEEPAESAKCPREAQVGTVSIKSPDIEETLEGQVYLAEPKCDPCTPQDAKDGKMVRLFVNVVGNGEAGIVVKLEGHGEIDTETGQITTVFEENPQLPFSELKLKLTGGSRAVLANPRACASASSSLDMSSWDEALPPASSSYAFEVNENCFGPQFKPSFTAGMPNIQAGEHGEFTLAFGREDDDQFLKQITLKMPPGLLGTLTGVELCKQAQANEGTCGSNSLIGETQVLTGPGANPFLVEGGKVYLTEGYGGSQFGLSIVVPAVAGPYTLGGVNGEGKETDDGKVVVRTQLFIDPHTAQITAVSGDLPSMLDGIPLQLRAVNVRLNRSGFMFNPTSCEKMAITGTIASQEGLSANVESPFQVTNCGSLPFKPVFKAATKAKHSRKDGAYLHVSVESSQGQADVRYAKVALPKVLPSELKTLQHACTEAQFNANPAGCPAESDVGTAEVQTPVVPVPLKGPAYFVSRGAQWPELIMVLQGYGVTVDLAGETHISNGVTTTTLASVPDVPFTKFSLTLPEQEYSALAGNGNLCSKQLAMPVRFVGQNGKTLEQDTQVQVEGCPGEIAVSSHRVKGKTISLKVYVPGAGKLQVSGKGLASKTKKPTGRKTVTVSLREKHAGPLKTKVRLAFTPSEGSKRKRQTTTLQATFK